MDSLDFISTQTNVNALSADKMKDDLKEMERENRTMSEKLKSQITSGKGTDLIYIKYKSIIR